MGGHTPAGTPLQPAGDETIHLGEGLFENSPVLAQDLRVGGAPLLQGRKQVSVPGFLQWRPYTPLTYTPLTSHLSLGHVGSADVSVSRL